VEGRLFPVIWIPVASYLLAAVVQACKDLGMDFTEN